MSKLESFLTELTDTELVNYYEYRYEQFMPASKKRITDELAKRNMKLDRLQSYVKLPDSYSEENIKKQKLCPQCFSEKFYNSKEMETGMDSSSDEFEVDYKTCLVCLYSKEKDMVAKKRNSIWNRFRLSNMLSKWV